jgi:hypothetical protein
MADWHEPHLRRFPWLYGPRWLRETWYSDEGWRRFVVAMAVSIIMVGFLWLFVADPRTSSENGVLPPD